MVCLKKKLLKITRNSISFSKINTKNTNNTNMILNFLNLKQTNISSTAISYKNRFLKYKATFSNRLASMYTLDGNKNRSLRLVFKYYLDFLRAYQGLKLPSDVILDLNLQKLNLDEFDFLYKTYDLFKDINRAFL